MKRSILIVDDMEINREILAEAFRDKYDILEAENGKEALAYLANDSYDVAAVLLDLVMPEMDGMTVLRKMNENGSVLHIPVFIITAELDTDKLMEAYDLGVVDVISKPFMMTFLRCRIENVIELYRHRNDLEDLVNEQVRKMNKFNQSMVEALATLVEFRDCESGEHIKRICGLTEILMNKVSSMYPEYRLPKAEIDKIVSASVLHDVGKIAIPDSILNKPGRLTPEEFEIMKSHSEKGCEILRKMPYILDKSVYNYSYDIARHHHERWDGKGYPDHLSGDNITIWSQVVSVADVYDALVSPRVYKKAFDHDTAVNMIMNGECGCFNPKILKAFELSLEKIRLKHTELSDKNVSRFANAPNLLIVDDSNIDRTILKNILEHDFKIVEAVNGYEALAILEDKNRPKIDGVLLDIAMPVIDGFTVLKILRENGSSIPVILMTAEATKENVERGIQYNIAGFIGKPYNPDTVLRKLYSIFEASGDKTMDTKPEKYIDADDYETTMMYVSQLTNLYRNYIISSGRDDQAYSRVSDVMKLLLEEYALKTKNPELDEDKISIISKAAYFYDIGKMTVPDSVLMKQDRSKEDLSAFEDHTKTGAYIVRLNKDKACRSFVRVCSDICMHHHERYDGMGYPHGLKGTEISDYTRLCSLVIEFDRLFSARENMSDWQFDFVIKELDVDKGRFDQDFVNLLIESGNELMRYYKHRMKKSKVVIS